jgi:hypothetical protein
MLFGQSGLSALLGRVSNLCFSWKQFFQDIETIVNMRSGVNQLVYCLTTYWNTGRWGFDPRQRQKDFSSCLCVKTDSGAQPASRPMGSMVLSRGKAP